MTCTTGKVGYPSEGAARRALRGLQRERRAPHGLHAYHCNDCGVWHLGGGVRPSRRRR